jgi:hypothetical protein
MEGEVLGIILLLSKYDSAVSLLNGLGAVEFLSQLRSVLEESYHGCIDSILQNLLHLPNSLPTSSSRPATGPTAHQRTELENEISTSQVSGGLSSSVATTEDPLSRTSKHLSCNKVSPTIINLVHSPEKRLSSAEVEVHAARGIQQKGLYFPLVSLTQNDDEILNSTFRLSVVMSLGG